MLKLLWPFKKYVRSDGGERGYTKKMRKRIGEEGLAKVYVIHILLRECFTSQLLIFVFDFFNGKVKTQTSWKVALYIAAHMTPPRYVDINF